MLNSDILKPSDQKSAMIHLLESFILPDNQDFEFGASYGLIVMQHYNNFDIRRLADGKVKALSKLLMVILMARACITMNEIIMILGCLLTVKVPLL